MIHKNEYNSVRRRKQGYRYSIYNIDGDLSKNEYNSVRRRKPDIMFVYTHLLRIVRMNITP